MDDTGTTYQTEEGRQTGHFRQRCPRTGRIRHYVVIQGLVFELDSGRVPTVGIPPVPDATKRNTRKEACDADTPDTSG